MACIERVRPGNAEFGSTKPKPTLGDRGSASQLRPCYRTDQGLILFRENMKAAPHWLRSVVPYLAFAALAGWGVGCRPTPRSIVSGYVEGEYVYAAAPQAGRLVHLHVQRGQTVEAGQPLFELEPEPESTRLAEAQGKVQGARATLADRRKGHRPSEMSSLRAQLAEAEAALVLATAERQRLVRLSDTHVASPQERDRAEAAAQQATERLTRIRADLATAELGARPDQIAAAEAEVTTLEAAVTRARWELEQKQPRALQAAQVHDTLFRVGEWVPAGRPVVVLLPPAQIKVRVFVPETRLGTLHLGDPAIVQVDGTTNLANATVAFIANHAEYTPPMLYSRDNRSQLVYLIELALRPEEAPRFHPGQPVDVTFRPR